MTPAVGVGITVDAAVGDGLGDGVKVAVGAGVGVREGAGAKSGGAGTTPEVGAGIGVDAGCMVGDRVAVGGGGAVATELAVGPAVAVGDSTGVDDGVGDRGMTAVGGNGITPLVGAGAMVGVGVGAGVAVLVGAAVMLTAGLGTGVAVSRGTSVGGSIKRPLVGAGPGAEVPGAWAAGEPSPADSSSGEAPASNVAVPARVGVATAASGVGEALPGVVASITGAVVATAWAAGAAGATVGGAAGWALPDLRKRPAQAEPRGQEAPAGSGVGQLVRVASVLFVAWSRKSPRLPVRGCRFLPSCWGSLWNAVIQGRLKHPQRRYLVGRTVDAQYLNPATLPPEKDVGRSARPWQNGSVDQHRAARWWLRGGRDGRIPALKPEVRGSAILTPYLPTRNLRGSYAPEEEKTETGHGCRGRESSRSPFPHARRVPGERPRVLGLVRTQ